MRSTMERLDELIGNSPRIAALREQFRRLVQRHSGTRRLPPLLIQGETGTGKGLIARAVHRAGPRAAGPLIDINCAAIPETLLEAELFGFERGAFTDARHAKPGLFQAAHHGTIFLDEIGLLPESLQGKLLTVIEDQQVRRLGRTVSEPIDVWIVAATAEPLDAAVRARRFREDLYHRLAVLTMHLPPLRERGDDIVLLAEHFLTQTCRDYHLAPKHLTSGARDALLAYPWPGNVRELANVMERVALLTDEPEVTAAMLGLQAVHAPTPAGPDDDGVHRSHSAPGPVADAMPLKSAVRDLARTRVLQALQATGWNISQAAAALGMSRSTLRYQMRSYQLHRRAASSPERVAPAAHTSPAPAVAPVIPLPAPPGLRWERRRVALMLAAVMPPDTMPAVKSRVLDALIVKARGFGARIDEVSPAGIVAVFGLEPVEDAPRRAAHCALAILKTVERERTADTSAIGVTIALHTGEFLVGRLDESPAIDLHAKRTAWNQLQALADRADVQTVAVSADMVPFLARRFELTPIAGEPAGAYRLVGHERLEPGRTTVFAGRRHELEMLNSRLESARRGRGQIVGIVGEPGMGKSRLLSEYRRRVESTPVTIIEGRCLAYGRGVPYLPIIEMLQGVCGVAESDSADVVEAKVRRALGVLEVAVDEVTPYVLRLFGTAGSEPLDAVDQAAASARTLALLHRVCLTAARQRPLILAVEDLHWIDHASELSLSAMADALQGLPIVLIATYRPGYRPPWIDRSYATQLALGPLGHEEGRAVIDSVLGAGHRLPAATVELILRRADGNPFFLEELAIDARNRGGADEGAFAVPGTVQEVLLARIQQAPDAARRVLQVMSVFGREVRLPLLREMLVTDDLDAALRELTRRDFVYRQPGTAVDIYVFKHALTQEVAYATLSPAERAALHESAGRAYEAVYATGLTDVYGDLAYHYARTNNVEKAVSYLPAFAERARNLDAHAEALQALEETRRHVETLPAGERAGRMLAISTHHVIALIMLGRHAEALDILAAQRPLIAATPNPAISGPFHFWLAQVQVLAGRLAEGRATARRALEDGHAAGLPLVIGPAHSVLGLVDLWTGQYRDAIAHARALLAVVADTDDALWTRLAHQHLVESYFNLGDFATAVEAVGQFHDSSIDGVVAMVAVLTRGSSDELRAHERELAGHTHSFGATATGYRYVGWGWLELGDAVNALAWLERARDAADRACIADLQAWTTALLADACLLDGDRDRATRAALEAQAIGSQYGFRRIVAWTHRTLAKAAAGLGDHEAAQQHLDAALRDFTAVDAAFEIGRTHGALAELARQRGNDAFAKTHLEDALRMFVALRVPRWADRMLDVARRWRISLPQQQSTVG